MVLGDQCLKPLETAIFSECQKVVVPGQQKRGMGEVSPSLPLQNTMNRKCRSFAIAEVMTFQVKLGAAVSDPAPCYRSLQAHLLRDESAGLI